MPAVCLGLDPNQSPSAAPLSCSAAIEENRNKDRIVGAAKTVAGAIKQAVGDAIGDQKTVADGKVEAAEGKVQNAVGGIKDAIHNVTKKK
jgi:uncharacterized protein YjbJ (UPF0337 family)